ncbi:Short transient receptor putative channel 4-associated protein [Desmophyllum pertusum]|uniref:Short transient receptor putative channel 4-associated protein n=1 Tax=Desmophyllum pertusum TaxID=174260 RepID=A0A9W9YEI2_9CNID|nr:Short transient receptor putative channel 4-associated protein [Desmophyllum pertusum]
MSKRSSGNKNLAASIIYNQVTGRCLRTNMLPQQFVEDVDRRLQLKEIPLLLAKLERNSSLQRFNITKCSRYIKELTSFFSETMQMLYGESELPFFAKERLRIGQVLNLFGGVEIVLRILFYPVTYGFKTCKIRPTRVQQTTLWSLCLDFIHNICLVVDGVAANLAKRNELISHLFTLLEQRRTFTYASVVLEDLFGSRKELIDLDSIANMRKLMNILDQQQLANLCRVLSFSLSDLESVEERSTLLAQDEVDKKGLSQKEMADNNQATLIGLKEFLPRIVRLACQPMVERSSHFLDMVDFHTFLQDVFMSEGIDMDSDEQDSVTPRLQSSFKHIHEVMHKVEVFYVLCLFLTGKHKLIVQKRLSEQKLIPGMCQLFDKMSWLNETERMNPDSMDIEIIEIGDHECTPQTALKIQFLRLVHSFCDRHENKHLLLTPREVDELQELYVQNDLELPESLSSTNRKLCCAGEKGLLTKILETLIRCPATAPLRFWLSRAIEGFLRGRASVGDQLFLIKRGLLEHLVDHITSEELKPKEILQSSFDLLGELMKFNPFAFKRFDQVIQDKQFEKFVSILTSNVVDSNMLIRCLVLSQEHFISGRFATDFSAEACKLGTLINNWEQMIFLLYKLINSITVGTLTQENVSCLNTTLVFLMFAHRHGRLPAYLTAFVREEKIQKNPGFILANLRLLLEFWKTHYLKRGKDCSALEQSSCISFDHWKQVVDVLLSDSTCSTSVLHYLPTSCTRDC